MSPPLGNKELMSLCGDDGHVFFLRDEDGTSEVSWCSQPLQDYELDSESSGDGQGGRGVRSSVSLEIYGLQREQQVHFTNLEYYGRLEELKDTHLRNMAELERMYISQGREWRGEGEGEEEEEGGRLRTGRSGEDRQSFSWTDRTLQRINSQEELDFNEASSGSDQSEDSIRELDTERRTSPDRERSFGRDVLLVPEDTTKQKHFRFQSVPSCPQPRGRSGGSKVTVPKPFQMMLREAERKRQKVRTRSEVELENTLLRRELDDLRECQKQFRASPAPAHVRLPLLDVIGRRLTQRSAPRSSRGINVRPDPSVPRPSGAGSPQPFSFLERERRKREARMVAELGGGGQGEEPRGFKARPMPTSVYGTRTKTCTSRPPSLGSLERGLNSDPEPGALRSKPAKKKIQVSIEMVKGGGVWY